VLGAMVVLLQAQAGLGFDLDTLDLEAIAIINAVIPAPGAMDLSSHHLHLFQLILKRLQHILDRDHFFSVEAAFQMPLFTPCLPRAARRSAILQNERIPQRMRP